MSVADEIRKLQMRKSAEQKARAARAVKRQAAEFKAKLQNDERDPCTGLNADFARLLNKKATQALERRDNPRPDIQAAIAEARRKGQLPPADVPKTRPEPTPEEILGDEIQVTEEKPDEENVSEKYPDELSQEDLEEIARLNPIQKNRVASQKKKR